MPNSDQLWDDMARLNSLYEELEWDADDELRFSIQQSENSSDPIIAIRNHTKFAERLYKQINGESAIHPQDR